MYGFSLTPSLPLRAYILYGWSLMKVKDPVIEALQEDNLKMQEKVEILEEQLSENKMFLNKLDQCNRRNNIKIQGIPSSVSDDALENKVIDIF